MGKRKHTSSEDFNRIDFDGKWKTIIESLFEDFIKFFLPELHDQIDFEYEAKFLKQDLPKIAADADKKGDLINDNLIEVRLKNGDKQFLLIHIEVHGYEHVDFGKKMFRYFYRIIDKFDKDVTAFALFLNPRLPKNHDHFYYKFGKTEVKYTYPVYLVREQIENDLKASDNPFALAILACMHINRTRKNYKGRYVLKTELFRLILDRYNTKNYDTKVMSALLKFMINVMQLPKALEHKFVSESFKPFKPSDNMNPTEAEKIFANEMSKVIFGDSIDEFIYRLEQEALLREIAENKILEEEKMRKEAESKQLEEQAKHQQDQINTILFLHNNFQLTASQIAEGLKFDLDFVKSILEKHISDADK